VIPDFYRATLHGGFRSTSWKETLIYGDGFSKGRRTTVMKLSALLLLFAYMASAATEEQINKTFRVASGGSLVVDVDVGSIEVNTNAAPGEIAVDVWRKISRRNKDAEERYFRENPVQFLPEGNTLTVRCRTKEWNVWFGGRGNRNEAKYTIHVPAQFNARLNCAGGGIDVGGLTGSVNANTSGGALRFTRLRGPLNGGTSGGGIRVEDCEGAIKVETSGGGIEVTGGGGSVAGETSGGGVTVRNFGGPASVETSGGGMTIENVIGGVKASTSGGPINAVLPSPIPGDVTLSTSGGGVTVKVPGNAVFDIDAETFGGGVRCDLPVTVQGKIEYGRLKGVVNGGGPAVVLRSSGGPIHIKKL